MSPIEEIRFGEWRLYPALRLLLHRETAVQLTTRAFDVLLELIRAEGEPVSKDMLLTRVWGNEVVEENNLQAQISAIRRVLGKDRNLIVTEFGRGYRFAGILHHPSSSSSPQVSPLVQSSALLTPLLGRDAALTELSALLRTHRLISILGPAGTGKTRLARELGERLRLLYQDGVHIAELAQISDPIHLWPVLSQALQISPGPSQSDPATRERLAQLHCLLVVDNCEHLVNAVSQAVIQLLGMAPHITVLITSQAALQIAGETRYLLPPLAVPDKTLQAAATLQSYPAVRLFVERGRANWHDFHPSPETLWLIGDLCRHLDGIPLAIELAASRIPVMSVQEIHAGLDDRFWLLSNAPDTTLPRHQTIKTAVDWSYRLLNEREQRLFRSLGIFPDTFTMKSVADIDAIYGKDHWHIVNDLQRLLALSMLQVVSHEPVTRFRLLETLRMYAIEKLHEHGEYARLSAMHTAYCRHIVRQSMTDWFTLSTGDWRHQYGYLINDLRAALQRTLRHQEDIAIGADILQSMVPFWVEYSLYDECQRYIQPLLQEKNGPIVLTHEQKMALSAAAGKASTWASGPTPATHVAWRTALTLGEQIANDEVRLQAHYGLWLYHLRTGGLDEALHHAEAMCQLSDLRHDEEALATGRRLKGVALHFLGQHSEGRAYLERSLGWFEQGNAGHPFRFGLDQQAAGQAFLSRLLWLQGETTAARTMAWRGVRRAVGLQHVCTLCCALAEGACMTAALNRNVRQVVRAATWLVRLASDNGLLFWQVYGELFLAWAKRGAEANGLFASLSTTGLDWQYSPLLMEIRHDLVQQWDHHNTRTCLWVMPELLRLKASTVPPAERKTLLALALEQARRQGEAAWILRIANDLAPLLAAGGEQNKAESLLVSALAGVDPHFPTADLRRAAELSARLQSDVFS